MLQILIQVLLLGIVPTTWAEEVAKAEVQWVICEPSEAVVFQKLGVAPGSANPQSVFYSETPAMDLFQLGTVVRTRVSGSKIKTAVKIKYQNENQIPWNLLHGTDFKCEWNTYASEENMSCSLKSKPSTPAHLISQEQKEFIRLETGFDRIAELQLLGPVQSREWNWKETRVGEDLSFESISWESKPSGSRFFNMELSARVRVSDKAKTFQKIGNWLEEKNIHLCKAQKGKSEALLRTLLASKTPSRQSN